MVQHFSAFPNTRLRRLRKTAWMRELVAQNHLSTSDLIMPFFVVDGLGCKEEVNSMPGVKRFSIDLLLDEVKKCYDLGIKSIMLFPCLDDNLKDELGSESYNENNLICRAVREIKKLSFDIGIICDVALDPFTSHGQDGIVDANGVVLNDETNVILCKQALAYAKSGCDIVAPSDMMDGRVLAIRQYLDANKYQDVAIMSYSAKYASSFYGPFRDAVNSKKHLLGDKKSYQMDFRNQTEALREIEMDVNEGADMVIIKPGVFYLDIVKEACCKFKLPIISYQVSGEYAMLKLASSNGLFSFEDSLLESLMSFKRAGATAIISYGAMEIAEFLT